MVVMLAAHVLFRYGLYIAVNIEWSGQSNDYSELSGEW